MQDEGAKLCFIFRSAHSVLYSIQGGVLRQQVTLKTVSMCLHSWSTLGTNRNGVLCPANIHFTRACEHLALQMTLKSPLLHLAGTMSSPDKGVFLLISSRQCWITEWSWPCKYLGAVFELGIVDMRICEKLLSVQVIHYKPCHSQQSLGFQLNWVGTCTSEFSKKSSVCVDMVK